MKPHCQIPIPPVWGSPRERWVGGHQARWCPGSPLRGRTSLWLNSTRKCAAVLVEHVEKGTGGGTGEFVIGLGNRDNEQPGGKRALFGGEVIVGRQRPARV